MNTSILSDVQLKKKLLQLKEDDKKRLRKGHGGKTWDSQEEADERGQGKAEEIGQGGRSGVAEEATKRPRRGLRRSM